MLGEQPSWAAYTGQLPEQYQHSGWLDAVHPEDRATTKERWERAVVGRDPMEYEHRLRRHDEQVSLLFGTRGARVQRRRCGPVSGPAFTPTSPSAS